MPSRKESLSNCKLYLILDRDVCHYEQLYDIALKSIQAGIDLIQLRDKHSPVKDILVFSQRLSDLTHGQVPFVINDRVDIAETSNASGVHLGQEDLSVLKAREILGEEMFIGASCQTLEQARKAEADGADYIGFGSVFKTRTKPDREAMDLNVLSEVYRTIKIPVFAIGGINLENVTTLLGRGVDHIAVCRAICQSSDIESTVKRFNQMIAGVVQWQNVSFPS